MYKLVTFAALLAVAAAAPGLIGSPYATTLGAHGIYGSPYAAPIASPWGHGLVGAPLIGAPVVKTALPVATSYANTVRIASPVVAASSPYVAGVAPSIYGHGW